MTAPTRTGSRKDEKITGQNPSIHAATKAGNTLSEPFFTALLEAVHVASICSWLERIFERALTTLHTSTGLNRYVSGEN